MQSSFDNEKKPVNIQKEVSKMLSWIEMKTWSNNTNLYMHCFDISDIEV